MTENDRRARYEETRRRFDDLDVEEQASFLVEATASTLARGLEQAGTALAGGIEELFQQARTRSSTAGSSQRPGAAEPETAQRQRPRWGQSTQEDEE